MTDAANATIDGILALAAHEAVTAGHAKIHVLHLLVALSRLSEEELPSEAASGVSALRREFQQLGIEARTFRRRLRALVGGAGEPAGAGMHRSAGCKAAFALAEAMGKADRTPMQPVHLLRAAFASMAVEIEQAVTGGSPNEACNDEAARPLSLGLLTQRLRALRQDLLHKVFGQDHAVHQFVDGLFSVEVVASADSQRRAPAGLFVFAGPPGVGKTYLAELGASTLDRPFKRFDMSSYAEGHESATLTGSAPVYKGAQAGILTGFVQRYPNALLLFDEIEKAHYSTIQLFLQILDAGHLQDKFTEQEVAFRDTVVIFTTNVGRRLYENENAAGVHQANAAFHRGTILDALRTEVDPHTRAPFFPAAICSRMATGHPILFNRLRVDDLVRIVRTELARVAALMQRQHGQVYEFADEVALALVMREGAQTDARTIKSQAASFLKNEVFKACQLFADERVDSAFETIETVKVEIDANHAGAPARKLFWELHRPSVLYIGDVVVGQIFSQIARGVDWLLATTPDQVFDLLVKLPVDFVLIDLEVKEPPKADGISMSAAYHDISAETAMPVGETVLLFDHAPLAARRYATGQQLLSVLHERMPETPVYLHSVMAPALALGSAVDEELLIACVRGGGARGVIRTVMDIAKDIDVEVQGAALSREIGRVVTGLRREKMAAELAANNQVVSFETAPAFMEAEACLRIRCRNFRLTRAVRSADAGALVSDMERPATRFENVFGANAAKEALGFIRDWLRDPKKYAAAGVEPPRGVLLTGPPGTGKTMLARSLAGESDCAFLSEAATGFVTRYQGSGPEAIRDLFARARRYSPSIVFIDEIDAIGGNRAEVKAGHVGHSESLALNQLLVEMDGFGKPTARPVIVIAATNRVETLDPALLRRFSRSIEVELPTRSEREQYLRYRLAAKAQHEVSEAMIVRLAAQGQGMSVADLERILAQASVMTLENRGVMSDAIIAEAFERVTMGEAKAGSDALRTARHEAGHALIMCATNNPPIYVTIVGRGSFGGYAALEDKEERRSRTKSDLEDHICQLLGGREAERLYYGEHAGASTGPSNDLERATAVAEAMVYDYGMSADIGFVKIQRRTVLPADLAGRGHAAVVGIIQGQSERAQKLLAEHREGLDRVVGALMEKGRLLQQELVELAGMKEEER